MLHNVYMPLPPGEQGACLTVGNRSGSLQWKSRPGWSGPFNYILFGI